VTPHFWPVVCVYVAVSVSQPMFPTCILREAGAVAVALGDGDAVLGADGAPVRGESAGRRGRLALGQSPLAGVAVPDAVGRLHTLPRHRVWWEMDEERKWMKKLFKD